MLKVLNLILIELLLITSTSLFALAPETSFEKRNRVGKISTFVVDIDRELSNTTKFKSEKVKTLVSKEEKGFFDKALKDFELNLIDIGGLFFGALFLGLILWVLLSFVVKLALIIVIPISLGATLLVFILLVVVNKEEKVAEVKILKNTPDTNTDLNKNSKELLPSYNFRSFQEFKSQLSKEMGVNVKRKYILYDQPSLRNIKRMANKPPAITYFDRLKQQTKKYYKKYDISFPKSNPKKISVSENKIKTKQLRIEFFEHKSVENKKTVREVGTPYEELSSDQQFEIEIFPEERMLVNRSFKGEYSTVEDWLMDWGKKGKAGIPGRVKKFEKSKYYLSAKDVELEKKSKSFHSKKNILSPDNKKQFLKNTEAYKKKLEEYEEGEFADEFIENAGNNYEYYRWYEEEFRGFKEEFGYWGDKNLDHFSFKDQPSEKEEEVEESFKSYFSGYPLDFTAFENSHGQLIELQLLGSFGAVRVDDKYEIQENEHGKAISTDDFVSKINELFRSFSGREFPYKVDEFKKWNNWQNNTFRDKGKKYSILETLYAILDYHYTRMDGIFSEQEDSIKKFDEILFGNKILDPPLKNFKETILRLLNENRPDFIVDFKKLEELIKKIIAKRNHINSRNSAFDTEKFPVSAWDGPAVDYSWAAEQNGAFKRRLTEELFEHSYQDTINEVEVRLVKRDERKPLLAHLAEVRFYEGSWIIFFEKDTLGFLLNKHPLVPQFVADYEFYKQTFLTSKGLTSLNEIDKTKINTQAFIAAAKKQNSNQLESLRGSFQVLMLDENFGGYENLLINTADSASLKTLGMRNRDKIQNIIWQGFDKILEALINAKNTQTSDSTPYNEILLASATGDKKSLEAIIEGIYTAMYA